MRVRILVFVVLCCSLVLGPAVGSAVAAPVNGLELSELLVDPTSPLVDSHDEYVELHNNSAAPVVLNDYRLHLNSSTYSLPAITLDPGAYFVQTSAQATWALSNSGNTLTLCLASDCAAASSAVDTTTWPAAVPGAGWMKQSDGNWAWTTTPTPGAANTLSAPPTPTPKPTSAPSGQASPVPVAAVTASDSAGPYAQLMLTELLPDPAAPQTDAHDEFIELYNPNDQPVDIKGYIIKTGASLGTKHTLPSAVIAPGTYLAVTSAASHIALSNSGTSLALYDPAGHQLGDTVTYGSAKPGQAWAWSESGWTWTTTPTPGAANHITAVSGQTGSSTGSVKGSTASKVSSPTSTTSAAKSAATSAASTHSGNWLIWVLVGLTICYCLYEFRHDLRRYYHQLRGHSGRRREASPAPEGR